MAYYYSSIFLQYQYVFFLTMYICMSIYLQRSSQLVTHHCTRLCVLYIRSIMMRATCLVSAGPSVMTIWQEMFTRHIIKRGIEGHSIKCLPQSVVVVVEESIFIFWI